MCWISSKKPIKKVATEDITVYKLLSFDLRAPFIHYRYFYAEKQKEIELKITERYDPYSRLHIIEKGYHSYSKLSTIKFIQKTNQNWMPLEIFICTIPKGSVYYENENDEVVSSNIIINRKLDKNYKL